MSPSVSPWQSAWEQAATRLNSLREATRRTSFPSSRIRRVGQLDAEILDQHLVSLLQEPISKALSLIDPSLKTRFDPEFSLVVRLLLYKLSMWDTGAFYGAKLQDLRYTVSSASRNSIVLLPRRTLLIHGVLTVVIPYLHNRLRSYALSRAWPDSPSSDPRRRSWAVLTKVESSHALLGLLNFLVFLWNGKYRTLSDRILGMTLVPSRRLVRRDISYEFMNRQMVWHAFTEFLLFLLPLISLHSFRRRITRLISSIYSFLPPPMGHSLTVRATTKRGKYYALPSDQCGICAENASYTLQSALNQISARSESEGSGGNDEVPQFPLNMPYVTSCGHEYCYHCIAERMMRATEDGADEPESLWVCLRCGSPVEGADRRQRPTLGGGSEGPLKNRSA